MGDPALPEFISTLDRDQQCAAEQFTRWALRMLAVSPPRKLYAIPEDARLDLIQEIILHCIDNNLRVLRQYRDNGRPFAAWFYFIARNKIVDHLRRQNSVIRTLSSQAVVDKRHAYNPVKKDETIPEIINTLRITNKCIAQLGQRCRLLLRLASDELLPREMARVLRMSKDKGKKISNDLNYCRRKLAELLKSKGVSLDEILG